MVWLNAASYPIKEISRPPNLYDFIFSILKGCSPYNPESKRYFELPLSFFLCFIGFLFILGNQITQELYDSAPVILTRLRHRYTWLIGKYLWGILTAILYWTLIYLITIFFAFLAGGEIFSVLTSYSLEQLVTLFVIPFMVFFAVSVIYITLSLLVSPIISTVIVSGLVCASAFLDNKWLLLNHTMLLRSKCFTGAEDGITPLFTILYSTLVCLVFFCIGLTQFEKMDILKRKEE